MTRYVPVAEQSDEDKRWMLEALKMARQAFEAAEVPVGSVFVRNGQVIARARNRTNELMNATRHAELEAIDYILSQHPPKDADFPISPHSGPAGDNPFTETTLYVTIEPCIMCASALRQVGIKRVVFGAGNERFGGNGSVLPVHTDPQLQNAPAYEAVGGYYREDAIMLLRRFYLTENVFAPNPRSKAKRVLKTYFQPPGVSMHGPTPQGSKKSSTSSSSRRRGRHQTSSSHAVNGDASAADTPQSVTPGGGSDTEANGSAPEPNSVADAEEHSEGAVTIDEEEARGAAAAVVAAAAAETESQSSVPPEVAAALDDDRGPASSTPEQHDIEQQRGKGAATAAAAAAKTGSHSSIPLDIAAVLDDGRAPASNSVRV